MIWALPSCHWKKQWLCHVLVPKQAWASPSCWVKRGEHGTGARWSGEGLTHHRPVEVPAGGGSAYPPQRARDETPTSVQWHPITVGRFGNVTPLTRLSLTWGIIRLSFPLFDLISPKENYTPWNSLVVLFQIYLFEVKSRDMMEVLTDAMVVIIAVYKRQHVVCLQHSVHNGIHLSYLSF